MNPLPQHPVVEEVSDHGQIDEARRRREQFDRNSAWLQAHIPKVYSSHRGRFICVAGGELFVADTAEEAIALASAAHPEDEGRLLRYIPKDRVARIYAHQRTLAVV